MKRLIYTTITLAIFFLWRPFMASAQTFAIDPNFNPDNIITDDEMLDSTSMTLDDIQTFLCANNSYLANYYTLNAYGQTKSAAQIIYDASTHNYDCGNIILNDLSSEAEHKQKCKPIAAVNPKVLLVLIQKEQGLINDSSPSQRALDWAAGYGCSDGFACSTNPYAQRFKGFGKQINSAALQFNWYVTNYNTGYRFFPGKTYVAKDRYSALQDAGSASNDILSCSTVVRVTPANHATAGLYNYTPHVFNGNYNFYQFWKKYFPTLSYPNGTLLQSRADNSLWLIEAGKKRPFANKAAFASRFNESKIITVDNQVLDAYANGDPIKFSNYSLLRLPDKKIYLIVDDKKRLFANSNAFKHFGFNPDEVIDALPEDLAAYHDGLPLTATSTYAYGALLQDIKTGGVFWVDEGQKAPLIDKVLLQTKFKGKKVLKVATKELDKYKKIAPVLFDDGELLRTKDNSAVYLIDNGQKRLFASGDIFVKLGYNWKNVITVSAQLLYLYPLGAPINVVPDNYPILTPTATTTPSQS
jgi:hypothetical protein